MAPGDGELDPGGRAVQDWTQSGHTGRCVSEIILHAIIVLIYSKGQQLGKINELAIMKNGLFPLTIVLFFRKKNVKIEETWNSYRD